MKLFIVYYRASWGRSTTLVEAESQEDAVRVAGHDGERFQYRITVEPVELKGAPGVRWCVEESPDLADSPRE